MLLRDQVAEIFAEEIPKNRPSPAKFRILSSGKYEFRFNGPPHHKGGIMRRCYPRVGTPNVTGNDISCVEIRRNHAVFKKAQVKLELYEDGHGSYRMATNDERIHEGSFQDMTLDGKSIHMGRLHFQFTSTDHANKAHNRLKSMTRKGKRCC